MTAADLSPATGTETSAEAAAAGAPPGAAWRRLREVFDDHKVTIYAFVASRLALLSVGLMTQVYIRPMTTHGNSLHLSRHEALNVWGAWDTGWYLSIARYGYARAAAPDGQANWAFFPAYPSLAAIVARLTHLSAFEAMLVVSNASFLLALILVHRLARAEFDRRTADVAVVLLCAAPGSYLFSAGYTEALFLAAATAALLLIQSRRWLAAGAAGGLAILTRNVGAGLLLPYAWAAGARLWRIRRDLRTVRARSALGWELVRIGVGAALPLAALAGFCLLLYLRTGDPLAFVHVEKAWGRSVGDPLKAPLRGLFNPGAVPTGDLVSYAACWLSFALLVALVRMRRWMLLSLAIFMTLAPLSTGLASYARYSLVVAPLWLAAARLLATRPTAMAATLIAMASLNGFLMAAWTLSLWVTT